MTGRLGIDDVRPVSGDGTYPSKAVVGEHVPVTATVWREGHDAVSATVVWRGPGERRHRSTPMHEQHVGSDLFSAVIIPDAVGSWTFRVDAWSDPWATVNHAIEVKLGAGQDAGELANDLEAGARLLDEVAARKDRARDKPTLDGAATALRATNLPLGARTGPALSQDVQQIMRDFPVREVLTKGASRTIWVDRVRAAYGSWYEFFPRSTGGVNKKGTPVHGTFKTATKELDRVAEMGFDVVYLPPIHPIGRVNRKGPNNSLTPAQGRSGLPVGHRRQGGRPRRDPPRPRHREGLPRLRQARRDARHGGGAGPRPAGRARPSVGHRASRVLHDPPGRHDRLRREPTEEVPGHLPAQLRQRSPGDLRGDAARHAALGRRGASASSASTIRTPSRRTSGRGSSRRSRPTTPTSCFSPRPSPDRRGCGAWPGRGSPRATPTSPGAPPRTS